ncbi:EpsG family protein [Fodinibius salsisoli]|uniref:EpsG family protein n=1 Tax=Fodinibius salsisoli TaxID=2820877 RepID=UPI002246C5CC|nr:EpsG family protein [Fodinibius salsisoli]
MLSSAIIFFAFLFLGLRDQYSGTDTIEYVNHFQEIGATSSFRNSWDFLYNSFAFTISQIGGKNFFIASNVLVQLCLILGIVSIIGIKNRSLVLLVYISFYPGFDMLTNGLRQGLSSCVALLIFVLAFHKRKIPKVVSLAIVLGHKSTLLYPIYYFWEKVLDKDRILKLIRYATYIFGALIVTWQLIDFSSFLSPFFKSIQIPLMDSVFGLGTKLNTYLTSEKDILSWIYRYYFLVILIFFLSHFYLLKSKVRLPLKKLPNMSIWGLTFLLSLIYALVWISPFSYRFMYTAYLPALVASINSLDIIGEKKYYVFYLLVTLLVAILTYGSNTYSNFKLIF